MTMKIVLTNSLVYEDKQTHTPKTRLGYRMAEEQFSQETDKFKGYAELSAFYDTSEAFNKIPKNFYGKTLIATVESSPNPRNPLKESKIISQLKLDNHVVDLL